MPHSALHSHPGLRSPWPPSTCTKSRPVSAGPHPGPELCEGPSLPSWPLQVRSSLPHTGQKHQMTLPKGKPGPAGPLLGATFGFFLAPRMKSKPDAACKAAEPAHPPSGLRAQPSLLAPGATATPAALIAGFCVGLFDSNILPLGPPVVGSSSPLGAQFIHHLL